MHLPSPPTGGRPNTEILDTTLYSIGFEIDDLSPHKVSGHLLVTSKCCQLSSFIEHLRSGYAAIQGVARRGLGFDSGGSRKHGSSSCIRAAESGWNTTSINHLKSAQLGDFVVAEATPVNVGKTIQVWEVHLSKCDPSNPENKTLIASSTVTFVCNLRIPESVKDAPEKFRVHHAMQKAQIV